MRPYREYSPDQAFLLPPSLAQLLPEDDPVFFLREVLTSRLDLSAFHERYRCERGQPPYHPALMAGLFFYGAMRRIYSSRRLADACLRDVGFMLLAGRATPDYHTIGEFRQRFTDGPFRGRARRSAPRQTCAVQATEEAQASPLGATEQ